MRPQKHSIIIAVLLLALFSSHVIATEDILYVQLQWYFEASATSVWLPQALNYYAAENLTVAVNQGGPNINVENYVQHQVADIGFGCLSVMLTSYLTGNPNDEMIAVAQIDQTSSYRLVSLRSSGIHSLRDMEGKRVCMWTAGGEDLSIRAALAMLNVTYQRISLGNTPYVLLAGDCDVIQVMSYNELGLLLQMTNPATGNLVQYDDINIFDMGEAAFAMENVIFVRKQWLNVTANQATLASFLRAVVRTAIFARDNPAKMLNYYNPSSNVDEWQLYITNQMAWNNASITNSYGHVNPSQVSRTIENIITYMSPALNATNVFDNTFIDGVVQQLKTEGYRFDVSVPTATLSWCMDIGASLPHVCRGDERTLKVKNVDSHIRKFNIAICSILACVTVMVFIATFINRTKPPIVVAAPNYLYMMLSGAIAMYIGSIIYNTGVTTQTCHVYIWCVSLGFTFLFMPYICKTWRNYRICDMSSLERKRQPPLMFAALMVIGVIVNTILLVLLSALKPIRTTPVTSPSDVYTAYKTCHWNPIIGYIIVGYVGLLVLSSVWLAIKIRNVKFKHVNDSGDMNASAFITAIIVIFTMPVVFFLKGNPNISTLIQTLGICVVAASNTGIMFAERLYDCAVLENGELQKRYKDDTSSSRDSSIGSSVRSSGHDYSLAVRPRRQTKRQTKSAGDAEEV